MNTRWVIVNNFFRERTVERKTYGTVAKAISNITDTDSAGACFVSNGFWLAGKHGICRGDFLKKLENKSCKQSQNSKD